MTQLSLTQKLNVLPEHRLFRHRIWTAFRFRGLPPSLSPCLSQRPMSSSPHTRVTVLGDLANSFLFLCYLFLPLPLAKSPLNVSHCVLSPTHSHTFELDRGEGEGVGTNGKWGEESSPVGVLSVTALQGSVLGDSR